MKFKDGLFLGVLIGLISAVLYTPKAGDEVRDEVREKINLVPHHFFNLFESLIDLSVSVLDFAKDSFRDQRKYFSKAVTTGLHAAKEKTEELRKFASNISSK